MSVRLQITTTTIPCTDCQREQREKDAKAKEQLQQTRTAAAAQKAELNKGIGTRIDVSV